MCWPSDALEGVPFPNGYLTIDGQTKSSDLMPLRLMDNVTIVPTTEAGNLGNWGLIYDLSFSCYNDDSVSRKFKLYICSVTSQSYPVIGYNGVYNVASLTTNQAWNFAEATIAPGQQDNVLFRFINGTMSNSKYRLIIEWE